MLLQNTYEYINNLYFMQFIIDTVCCYRTDVISKGKNVHYSSPNRLEWLGKELFLYKF